jgi:hypothetical protein
MPLKPGPVALFDVSSFDLTPEPPEFETFARGVEAAVIAAENETAGHADSLSSLSAQWVQDASTNTGGLDEAELEIGTQSAAPLEVPASISPSLPTITAGLDDAAGRLPAEAFLADAPTPPAVIELVPSPEPPPGQTVPPPLNELPVQ